MFRLLFSWAAGRKRSWLYTVGGLLAVFAVLSPFLFYRPATAELHTSGKTISLEIASTQAQQNKGLGGRQSMSADKGMLFVFQQPAKTCLWMKDMRFPIDMIWLNGSKQVTYLQTDVSPRTYPKAFCPPSEAKYIIELNANESQKLDITEGKTLSF